MPLTSYMLRDVSTQDIIKRLETEMDNFNNYTAEVMEDYRENPFQMNPKAIENNITLKRINIQELIEILKERVQ